MTSELNEPFSHNEQEKRVEPYTNREQRHNLYGAERGNCVEQDAK